MQKKELENQFELLCNGKLCRDDAKVSLLNLAQAFKTHAFYPSLDALIGAELQRGGYILDLFSLLLPMDGMLNKKQMYDLS